MSRADVNWTSGTEGNLGDQNPLDESKWNATSGENKGKQVNPSFSRPRVEKKKTAPVNKSFLPQKSS